MELLIYLKDLIRKIAEQFRGARTILTIMDRQDTITKLIGFSAPYLNITREEKQELLETRSLHKRGIKFLDHLIKQKESMKLRITSYNVCYTKLLRVFTYPKRMKGGKPRLFIDPHIATNKIFIR